MQQELVRDWMTTTPVTVQTSDNVMHAYQILSEHDVRRLPVIDENRHLVGIITIGDIREAFQPERVAHGLINADQHLSEIVVATVMTPNPITIRDTHTIVQAANFMLENKISGLPVTSEDGQLLGVITESDIFRLVVQNWTPDVQENM